MVSNVLLSFFTVIIAPSMYAMDPINRRPRISDLWISPSAFQSRRGSGGVHSNWMNPSPSCTIMRSNRMVSATSCGMVMSLPSRVKSAPMLLRVVTSLQTGRRTLPSLQHPSSRMRILRAVAALLTSSSAVIPQILGVQPSGNGLRASSTSCTCHSIGYPLGTRKWLFSENSPKGTNTSPLSVISNTSDLMELASWEV